MSDNTERDELARETFVADNHRLKREDAARDFERLGSETYAHRIADGLLAAGYRKPRTITTAAELDALPGGSLILDSDPDVMVKRNGRWHSPDHPDDSFGPASIGFPATVLFEATL